MGIKMRLYRIHRKFYLKYIDAQRKFEAILDEQEMILQKVQPKSSLAEHDREHMATLPTGSGKTLTRKAEEYAIEMERRNIRQRLNDARGVLEDRLLLLEQKEAELRKSKDIYNVIYLARWVDGKKPEMIATETGYSRSQVYAIIKHLDRQI